MNNRLTQILMALAAALVFGLPAIASAGSYPVNCDVKAELDKKSYSFSVEHYDSKKNADFGKPHQINFSIDSKAQKLKGKKKLKGLYVFDFDKHQVVYSGGTVESLERFAFFYDKDGKYIARVKCK